MAVPTQTGVIGVVVHPRRPIDDAIAAVRAWADEHGHAFGQIAVAGQDRRVADVIEANACTVVVAVGGDGTVLAALHAAAPVGAPVLGVACGSLGALTSVRADAVGEALDRVASGEAAPRSLPALVISRDGEPVGEAFNDLAVVRGGAGQVVLDVDVAGAQFARMAGDGVVVATPLGSSAYTLAAGGPLIAVGEDDMLVVTPLAPHAGAIPPLVLGPHTPLSIVVDGGWAGARVELDGRVVAREPPEPNAPPFTLDVVLRSGAVTLLDLDGETLIAGLRRRGVISDSPRLRARDARGR